MKNKKITKRDIKAFLLGLLTALVISAIMDWPGTKKSFKEGWDAGYNKTKNVEQ